MKKSTRCIKVLLLISFIVFNNFQPSFASEPCMLIPLTLQEKVSNSPLIIEGKVVSSISYWNKSHTKIFTQNKIKVFKVFKGNDVDEINVITEGGMVGLQIMKYTSTLELMEGEEGMFFCMLSPFESMNSGKGKPNTEYTIYSSLQGFYKYDSDYKTASAPFVTYPDIANSLYREVETLTGNSYKIIAPNPFFQQNQKPKTGVNTINAVPTITNFTPASITAGTRSLLTINGTNFGTTRGTGFVEFRNADNGGSSYVKAKVTDYKVWNNTQIQLWVPSSSLGPSSSAGTGTIRVTNSDPSTVTSATNLTIIYSITNVEFNGFGQILENENFNGLGGYTYQIESSIFAINSPAVASFKRSMYTWICATRINWRTGANTATNTASNDGIFLIRFDIGSELPVNVLARTSLNLSGCIFGDTVWTPTDIDLTFDNGVNWQYGPAGPSGSQYDFETVSLHELGHAHNLQHIISPGAVMHYAISNGASNRVLSAANDIAGGNYIMTKNTASHACKTGAMISLTPAAAVSISSSAGTTICSGTSVTFTASPTEGGATPAYQWKKNGTNVGTNSATYVDAALANGNQISCVMTSSTTCATGNPSTSNTITMTVTTSVAASVTISRNPSGAICPGTNVVFTAVPMNQGSTPSYQWKKNGTNVGTNSTTFSATNLVNGDQITCTMTSNATCVTGSPATSNTITIVVNSINDGNACTTDACNTTTGIITHTNVNINDNNACTTDACNTSSGAITHSAVNVGDGNACTTDGCDSVTGIFHNQVNTDDGNACTTDGCNSQSGIFHNSINIDDNNVCTTDACDSSTGSITHDPITFDDNNECTTDGCNSSSGEFHNPVTTDDGNVCTTDGCESATGIFHNPVNTDDANACTVDGCDSITGVYHNQINSDDGNVCTTDACNSSTGTITHDPISTDDNNACTTDDCDSVTGVYHNPVNTDDGNACTIDECNSATGLITHNQINTDDGNACTTDACDSASGIVTHDSVNVDDGNGCTTDGCNSVTGVFHTPNGSCGVTLNSNIIIQGFYTGGGMMDNNGSGGCLFVTGESINATDADSIRISAMNPVSPFGQVDEQTAILKTNGIVIINFSSSVIAGNSYYLKIVHRNSVETWSSNPVLLNASTTYSFSSGTSQAFGSNQAVTSDNLFAAIYSGDINHDGAVDGSDFLELDPSIQNGDGGYAIGDLNGDGAVDGSDFLVLDPNIQGGVGANNP